MKGADKRIATVDGVVGNIVKCTLSINARGTPVRGKFVLIKAGGDVFLGRIVSVDLTNQVHEDATFSAFIMMNGAVPHWSGEVDIEKGDIEIIRVIDDDSKVPVPLRRNPSSGTAIDAATDDLFDAFSNERDHRLYLGTIPNSDGLRAHVINRHHGEFDDGGYGEARHCCLFGQNGSGKTVMATMLLAGKLAAHPRMGVLIPDTAGDLSESGKHNRAGFQWDWAEVSRVAGVQVDVIDIADIRLSSTEFLGALLDDLLCKHMGLHPDKARTLSPRVVGSIFENDVKLEPLTSDAVLDAVVIQIGTVYAKAGRKEKVEDAEDLINNPGRRPAFDRQFAAVRRYFDGRVGLDDLIKDVLSRGRKVVIRMQGLPESAQAHVMRELMHKLTRMAQRLYKGGHRLANAIVMLDEAARWVPEGNNNDDDISGIIERAARETRKYGLGWWFIAQSPSTVSKTILREAHTKWFGRGLGIGADRNHLDAILGKHGVEEYERLMMQGGYFWIGIGLDNNIGTEGTYFAVHPFGGDATKAFINANPNIFR